MRMSEAIPKSIAPISAEDIKAAAIRSDLAYKAMREESITASMFSEQDNLHGCFS